MNSISTLIITLIYSHVTSICKQNYIFLFYINAGSGNKNLIISKLVNRKILFANCIYSTYTYMYQTFQVKSLRFLISLNDFKEALESRVKPDRRRRPRSLIYTFNF